MSQRVSSSIKKSIPAPFAKQKCQVINPELITSQNYANQIQIQQNNQSISIQSKHTHQSAQLSRSDEAILQQDRNTNNLMPDSHCQQTDGLTKLYVQIFGHQALDEALTELKVEQLPALKQQKMMNQHMVGEITHEIVRLQSIQADYVKFNKLLQKSAKSGSNQQKWKIIVLTYRQKMQKYETSLQEERRMNALLKKELNAGMQEIKRLSNMNNIKFQRLNAVTNDLDLKTAQTKQLSGIISKMEVNLTAIEKQKQTLTLEIMELTQSLNEVSQSLQLQRQKSILYERQKQQQSSAEQTKLLSAEDEDIQREIADVKSKYEYQIVQLQAKINDYYIEREEFLLKIMELEHKHKSTLTKTTQESYSQTQQNVVKAVFYNSLEDDLEEQHENANENIFSKHQRSEESDCQFELSIDPRSINNHRIDTPREFYDNYSEKEGKQNHRCHYNADASFDEENSMSNAPSRYMETVQQMTSELTQAYQRINELTQKIDLLEQENKRIMKSQSEKEKQGGSSSRFAGGLFNSFFKK